MQRCISLRENTNFHRLKTPEQSQKTDYKKEKKCGASLTDQKLRSKTMGVIKKTSNRKTGKE